MLLLNTWYTHPSWHCIALVLYPFVYLQVCYFLLTDYKNLNIPEQVLLKIKHLPMFESTILIILS